MTSIRYTNGNSTIEIFEDGTRVVETLDSSFDLEFPLNLDIRCSTKCSFGYNPKTGKSVCGFCHESSRTDGIECNYDELKNKLKGLPKGIELAIGSNDLTFGLQKLILWCGEEGYIVNLTINQGHIKRDIEELLFLIEYGYVRGLGISYRQSMEWDVPKELLKYPNTVFHVIAGIDEFNDVLTLSDKGVKKILILGEKDFGFNQGKVNLESRTHKQWYWWVRKLFHEFDVISFDNLALEQLNMKRFLTDEQWDEFHQGEHSFYINAVEQYFAPSSRSSERTNWNDITVKDYYKLLKK